ncbi:MAG: hypothetical protein C4584_00495 [Armatimonadetes bacterium]|nr:MAG: hypothetical protein C4584_00495 [Armatimonadota bacterium]
MIDVLERPQEEILSEQSSSAPLEKPTFGQTFGQAETLVDSVAAREDPELGKKLESQVVKIAQKPTEEQVNKLAVKLKNDGEVEEGTEVDGAREALALIGKYKEAVDEAERGVRGASRRVFVSKGENRESAQAVLDEAIQKRNEEAARLRELVVFAGGYLRDSGVKQEWGQKGVGDKLQVGVGGAVSKLGETGPGKVVSQKLEEIGQKMPSIKEAVEKGRADFSLMFEEKRASAARVVSEANLQFDSLLQKARARVARGDGESVGEQKRGPGRIFGNIFNRRGRGERGVEVVSQTISQGDEVSVSWSEKMRANIEGVGVDLKARMAQAREDARVTLAELRARSEQRAQEARRNSPPGDFGRDVSGFIRGQRERASVIKRDVKDRIEKELQESSVVRDVGKQVEHWRKEAGDMVDILAGMVEANSREATVVSQAIRDDLRRVRMDILEDEEGGFDFVPVSEELPLSSEPAWNILAERAGALRKDAGEAVGRLNGFLNKVRGEMGERLKVVSERFAEDERDKVVSTGVTMEDGRILLDGREIAAHEIAFTNAVINQGAVAGEFVREKREGIADAIVALRSYWEASASRELAAKSEQTRRDAVLLLRGIGSTGKKKAVVALGYGIEGMTNPKIRRAVAVAGVGIGLVEVGLGIARHEGIGGQIVDFVSGIQDVVPKPPSQFNSHWGTAEGGYPFMHQEAHQDVGSFDGFSDSFTPRHDDLDAYKSPVGLGQGGGSAGSGFSDSFTPRHDDLDPYKNPVGLGKDGGSTGSGGAGGDGGRPEATGLNDVNKVNPESMDWSQINIGQSVEPQIRKILGIDGDVLIQDISPEKQQAYYDLLKATFDKFQDRFVSSAQAIVDSAQNHTPSQVSEAKEQLAAIAKIRENVGQLTARTEEGYKLITSAMRYWSL